MRRFLFLIPLLLVLNTSGKPYSAVIHLNVHEANISSVLQSNESLMVNVLYMGDYYITVLKRDLESHVADTIVLEKRHLNGSLLANVSFDFPSWTMDPAHEGGIYNTRIVESPMGDYFFVADIILVAANLTSSREDDPYYIDFNILVVKMNSTLNPQWAWVVGGDSMESVRDIAVDNNGNLYVFGLTTSYNFPTTTNAFQPLPGNFDWKNREDFFLSKFTADGNLSWSTFIGGIYSDFPIGMILENDTLFILGYTDSYNFPVAANDQLWKDEWLTNLVISEFSLDGELLHTNFVFQEQFLAGSPNSWFSAGGMELLDDGSFIVAADIYVADMEKYESVDNLYSYNISRSYPFNYDVPFLRMVVKVNASFSPVWVTGFVKPKEGNIYYAHVQNVVQVNDSVAVTMYESQYNTSYVSLLDVGNGTITQMGNSSSYIMRTVKHNGMLYIVGNSGTTGFIGKLEEIPVPKKKFPRTLPTSEDIPSSYRTTTETKVGTTLKIFSSTPSTEGTKNQSATLSIPVFLTFAIFALRKRNKH